MLLIQVDYLFFYYRVNEKVAEIHFFLIFRIRYFEAIQLIGLENHFTHISKIMMFLVLHAKRMNLVLI